MGAQGSGAAEAGKPAGWGQLDTLRLVLSLLVVASHANYIFLVPLGHGAALVPLQWLAWFAVLAFFVLSGLVIGRSLRLNQDGFFAFMQRRFWRLYPPLLACFAMMVVLDVAMKGAGVSTEPIAQASPMLSSFAFDLQRAGLCLITFGFRGWLSSDANGALWSLVIEMRCYVMAGLFAYIFLAKSRPGKLASAGAFCYLANFLLHDRLDYQISLSYLAFGAGLVLSLFVRDIPKLIPAVPVDLSYSLYILHFPLMLTAFFVVYQPAFPSAMFATFVLAGSVLSSIALAYLSACSIEKIRGRALKGFLADAAPWLSASYGARPAAGK